MQGIPIHPKIVGKLKGSRNLIEKRLIRLASLSAKIGYIGPPMCLSADACVKLIVRNRTIMYIGVHSICPFLMRKKQ